MIKRSPKSYNYSGNSTEIKAKNGSTQSTKVWTSDYKSSFMQGWNNKNFHARKKRGDLLPHTPFYQSEYNATAGGSYNYTRKSTGNAWSYTSYEAPASWHPWVLDKDATDALVSQYDLERLVQQVAANIYGQGFDALTFIGELNKTIRSFMNLRKSLVSLLKADNLARSWLEYRYTWRILYFEMQDLSKAFASLDDGKKRLSERIGFTESYTNTTIVNGVNGTHIHMGLSVTDTVTTSLRAHMVADIKPPSFQFNPLTTAWELIRFSFIVDWFIKVGTWLSALSFLAMQVEYTAAGGVQLEATRNCEGIITWKNDSFFSAGPNFTWNAVSDAKVTARYPQRVSILPHIGVTVQPVNLIDLWALTRR